MEVIATNELFDEDKPSRYVAAQKQHTFNPLVFFIVCMLCGALAGGGATYAILGNGRPLVGAGVVTVQVASSETKQAANATQQGITRVASVAAPSVLEVTTDTVIKHPYWGSYVESGAGSAIVMSKEGYLITNNHVIEGATSIHVRTIYGDTYEAALVGADAASDIAVLLVNASGLEPVVFADSDAARVGDLAIAIGNPLGTLGGTVTEGIISAKDRSIVVDGENMMLIQTSAAINPGNSGGGLFDGEAHLVGVVSMKSSGDDIEGLGFAIPSNIARNVASELVEYGYVRGRPAIGVAVGAITSRYNLMRYGLSEAGIYVIEALPDNQLQVLDRIVTVNGHDILTEADMKAAINTQSPGDAAEVVIVRGGQRLTVNVVLMERNGDVYDDMV